MINKITLLTVLALLSPLALAQNANQEPNTELRLFEPLESSAQPEEAGQRPTTAGNSAGSPQFTLIGTSRIAGRQTARLKARGGETVVVPVQADGQSPIPGYPGFFVEEISGRQLVIRHPSGNACNPANDQGVSCLGNDVSRLQLTTAAPIERQVAEAPRADASQSADATQEDGSEQSPPDNPFAAALRAARERGEQDEASMRAEAQRFRPRRIDPADVPPGARLVRTPFGDRIVRDQ